MITNVFITITTWILWLVSYSIPNWLIPDSIEAGFSQIIDRALTWNSIIPIADILLCTSVIIYFYILIYSFRAIAGLASIVRGGGSIDV